jgi:hypothetical protein
MKRVIATRAASICAIGEPARLERAQPEVAERHIGAAPRLAAHAAALLLPILDFLRHQH